MAWVDKLDPGTKKERWDVQWLPTKRSFSDFWKTNKDEFEIPRINCEFTRLDSITEFDFGAFWHDNREPTKRPRPDSDEPAKQNKKKTDTDKCETKMIDTTGAESRKMINHSSMEYESECEMGGTSTKAESDDLNPLLDETKPDMNKLDKYWFWWNMFAPSYSELSTLFCGRARIDYNGFVHHDPKCNATDSSLKTQIECDCVADDVRDPYNSESVDPLK